MFWGLLFFPEYNKSHLSVFVLKFTFKTTGYYIIFWGLQFVSIMFKCILFYGFLMVYWNDFFWVKCVLLCVTSNHSLLYCKILLKWLRPWTELSLVQAHLFFTLICFSPWKRKKMFKETLLKLHKLQIALTTWKVICEPKKIIENVLLCVIYFKDCLIYTNRSQFAKLYNIWCDNAS